jgi:hypothetical protein
LISFTKVEATDLITGTTSYINIINDSVAVFTDLKRGHSYQLSLVNVSTDNQYSHKVMLSSVKYLSPDGNNPPVVQNFSGKPYLFKEGKMIGYSVKAIDPEGGVVSYSILENMPKAMFLINDSLKWCPQVGDAGNYRFHLVVSDGNNNDTLLIKCDVMECYRKPVKVEFPTANLFEADNMFVSITDEYSDSQEIPVKLMNKRTRDSISIKAYRTDEGKFTGNFQLSYQRRSLLPVSDGDTIYAIYIKDNTVYWNYAYYNKTPQIVDHIAPGTISDLKAIDLNSDSLLLVFTVPSDQMDNGTVTSPWVYDIRYSYTNLNSEDVFLKSLNLENYEVGKYGTKDTVVILKKTLYDFDKNSCTWFNVKVGDTRFNYSNMSNTVKVQHIVPAQNVTAALTTKSIAKVTWVGPAVDPTDDFFTRYNIYRSNNSGNFELIGHALGITYMDTLTEAVEDGIVEYAVEAEYKEQMTDAEFSNVVSLSRFTNVTVKLRISPSFRDSIASLQVSLVPSLKSFKTLQVSTNDFGYAYLNKTLTGTYNILVKKYKKTFVNQTVEVSDLNNVFEYYLDTAAFIPVGISPGMNSECSYQVYPNPSIGKFMLEKIRNSKPIKDVIIYGIDGKMHKPKSIDMSNPDRMLFDLDNAPKGMYTISIYFDDEVVFKKLLIE